MKVCRTQIIEYTQRRIPTIAYDTGDIKKILNNCGIVFKKNNQKLSQKIKNVYKKLIKDILYKHPIENGIIFKRKNFIEVIINL